MNSDAQNPFGMPGPDEWAARFGDIMGALFAKSMGDRFTQAFLSDNGSDLAELALAWQENPQALLSLQQEWLARVGEITSTYVATGDEDVIRKAREGSRELHQALSRVIERYVEETPSGDRQLKQRLGVASRLWVSALAPDNFLFANSLAMEDAASSRGASLEQGLKNLEADLAGSPVGLRVRSAESDGYSVGESLAVTHGEVVYQNELMQLIQYYPTGAEVRRTPMLIIPPWINKFYILDLTPSTSMVRWLVQQGHTVFCISWVNPGAELRHVSFDDYLVNGCLPALKAIQEISGEDQVNVAGYCIGGVLASCLAAWHAAAADVDEDGFEIKSLSLFNTLLDYTDPGDISMYLRSHMMAALDDELSATGFLDGSIMSVAFSLLRAEKSYWPQFIRGYLRGKAPDRDPLSHWNFDATNLPEAMVRQYLEEFYLQNRLATPGKLELCGRKLDLSAVAQPTIAVSCERDHLVPWPAAFTGASMLGANTRFILVSGGHVSGILQHPDGGDIERARSYHAAEIFGDADEWRLAIPSINGSWWPAWHEALPADALVAARFPGNDNYPPLEPAPGSYVLATL